MSGKCIIGHVPKKHLFLPRCKLTRGIAFTHDPRSSALSLCLGSVLIGHPNPSLKLQCSSSIRSYLVARQHWVLAGESGMMFGCVCGASRDTND